jgi:maltooligosyltrehalose trehalohydrolase
MQLLPLDQLGPRELKNRPGVVSFGLFLPWVSAVDGNRLYLKIIHEDDQFLQQIQPLEFELAHSLDPSYGDYWSVEVDIANTPPPQPNSAWGSPGRYVYRYCLSNPNAPGLIDWIIDPFAREFGVGKLSAFTLGYQPYVWNPNEPTWKTPALDDLVIYELMISEFGGDIDRTIKLLDYLADLGVNCLEVMPVSNVSNVVDWGFLPLGYFGVDERFGKRYDMQRFIDAAHQRGLAVIIDSVYGHTSDSFPYQYVYDRLSYHENPFMGSFAKDYFGKSTDFGRAFTRDFFYTVSHHWLECYHVDGFRYDCVPNYYDGPLGNGYAALVYETYQLVKAETGASSHWQRFFAGGGVNLIQCAEQLEEPRDILEKTYSTCTWQNETLGAAQDLATKGWDHLTNLGYRLGLMGYPDSVTANNETLSKSGLQYIENHDHSRFVCNFGLLTRDNVLLSEGNRDLWFKVQPYLIGLLTAKGIPLLWQGQEFGENYFVPPEGWGRVMLFRPVRWDYFYDHVGKTVIWLVRRLLQIRRQVQFRQGAHYFYNDYDRYQSKGVLLFSRSAGHSFSLVALNFTDVAQSVPFAFPFAGDYQEELHGQQNLIGLAAAEERWLTIDSNYGCIWTGQSAA